MSSYIITIKPGPPAVFDPSPQIAVVNDSVSWQNDDSQQHWPAPSATNPKSWLDYPIAPGGQSAQISFDPPAPYTLNYVCALHPNETGQIRVSTGKKTSSFARKTKKGPFGRKTKKGPFGSKTKKSPFGYKTK